MPKFLEDKLRQEYGNNDHAIYGTMNKIGAMHGNKTTAKGMEMERKHNAHIRKMAGGGVVTGDWDPGDPYDPRNQGMQPPPPPMAPGVMGQPGPGIGPVSDGPPEMPQDAPPPMQMDQAPPPQLQGALEGGDLPDNAPPPPVVTSGTDQQPQDGPPDPESSVMDSYLAAQQSGAEGGYDTDSQRQRTRTPFGQGSAYQNLQRAGQDYADLATKKQPLWRGLTGGLMAAFKPTRPLAQGVMHPGLAQAAERLKGLKGVADEERLMQQAQSNEELKNDQLLTNEAYRNRLLGVKENTPAKLTGDAQKVALLEEGYTRGGHPDPRAAALADYKAEVMERDVWRKGDIIPSAESITGYARRMYDSRTGKETIKQDVVPGVGWFGTTTTTSQEKPVQQANNDIAKVKFNTDVTKTPNIPGRNPLGVAPMAPAQGGVVGATPTPVVTSGAAPAKPEIIGHHTPAEQSGSGGVSLTPAALEQAARIYAVTKTLPTLARDNKTKLSIMNRAADLAPGADIATNAALYGADKSTLAKITATAAATDAFEGLARRNLDRFISVAQHTVDTGAPWLNTVFRGGARQLGDESAAEFEAARVTAFTEVAKVLNNPASNAILSEGARHEAEAVIDGSYTYSQLVRVANLLKTEMGTRKEENDRVINGIVDRMRGRSANPGGTQAPAGGQAYEQFSKSRNAYRYTLDGGKSWLNGRLPNKK